MSVVHGSSVLTALWPDLHIYMYYQVYMYVLTAKCLIDGNRLIFFLWQVVQWDSVCYVNYKNMF